MLTDRYGLALSTGSEAARDAYVEACDALLTSNPGAVEGFERAIAADPAFALAHAGKARALQLQGSPAAQEALGQAVSAADRISAREASHTEVFRLILSGQAGPAFAAVRAHLDEWPRDAMVLSTSAAQLGLIGLSGRAGRDRELAAFLGNLAPHYGEDPWFEAHYGMALSEIGEQEAARPKLERSLAQNGRNAYVAHGIAHLYYETGEQDEAVKFIRGWLPTYSRQGMLYGHLAWHLALVELERGDVDEAFRLCAEAFGADQYPGPALIKVIDTASFLWRSELAGHGRDDARWRSIHEFARKMFPRGGMAYADWHVALADAVMGDDQLVAARVQELEDLIQAERYPAGGALPALTRAFAAFERRDYETVITQIEPMLAERERIGGSRAQIDLVELTLLKAYLATGRLEEARRLKEGRRKGPGLPVAGAEALH